ncbi:MULTISPECIES: leucine-rich repeat domain-containing protein [Calothrix]|uniref:Leucine-rich repeat domain-containing protein n=2 Tax=Calothrix TaxID=1186 RepID=A0ABR8AKD5_9CYAN|nr:MULTISPECIES: leucine-rich repeat domain-containing protein [Calothrix]MBD2199072.1 leucine-rich repeat domain-containing protein [Calothrix parietina FACHB-288]MBD2227774.1 leucine-rich repeat domain-containing protein [Calothrix anomala FACHB-343]
MEQLQNLLSQEPTKETWEQLIEFLDNWSDEASLSTALDYAEQQLDEWPDYLRAAPSQQWTAIQNGASLPPWWKLVRHIEIGEDDNILEPFPVEALQNITSIKLVNCDLLPEDLYLLARLNKLGTLDWYDLIDSLDEWPEDEQISEILDYAEEQLADWSDEDREAPQENWKAIREGAPIPRWWRLVRHLELGEYDNSELSPIEAFINLTSLEFNGINLGSLEILTELTKLTSLKLVDDLIPFSIEPLSKLTQLRYLRLTLAELTDLDGLDELKNLEYLDLSDNNGLTNIDSLAVLNKLTWLSLEDCEELNDLTPLSTLTKLKTLDLSNCKSLTDISSLAGLNQLESLYLKGCDALTDISPLANLHALRKLDISDCDAITDLSPLESLSNCRIRQ